MIEFAKTRTLLVGLCACATAFCGPASLSIDESENSTSFRLGDKTLWSYRHNPAEGKPYFHPLSNTKGTVLTDLRPEDHPWHRGLWFSWKYINGVNYWEEDRETGQSEGRTLIDSFERTIDASKAVAFNLSLSYRPSHSDVPVLRESRSITVLPPDPHGSYAIEWSSTWQPVANDAVLDRTSIPGEPSGKAWGGYAGLSLRMTQDLSGGTFLNSEGRKNDAAISRPARWVSYTPKSGATVVFMDHPQNLRYPNMWYISQEMNYLSPAPLFEAPYTLKASDSLTLLYKMVIATKALTFEEIESLWEEWTR